MPSIYSLVPANKIKKIESAKNIFSNIIKNIPPEDYKKFKIEYDQSSDISISEINSDSDAENSQSELTKRANNLFNALQKNPKSFFYLAGHANSITVFNKAAKSAFEKDKVFVNLYNKLDNKKVLKNQIKIFYLLPRHFTILKVIWTIQHYIALVSLLSYCMLILQILDFLPNLSLIRNIVFCLWIYLLQKYIFIP